MNDIDFIRQALATWCSGEACERFERLVRTHEALLAKLGDRTENRMGELQALREKALHSPLDI